MLLETLEEEAKAANISLEDLGLPEIQPEEESDYDEEQSRERIAARRASQSESGTPQSDGGEQRGLGDNAQGSGETTSENGSLSRESDERLKTSEGETAEQEPKTPGEWAAYRQKLRAEKEENRRLKEQLAAVSIPKVETPKPTIAASPQIDLNSAEAQLNNLLNSEPNKEQDAASWVLWNAEVSGLERQVNMAKIESARKEREAEAVVSGAMREVETFENNFKQQKPDYDLAMSHAKKEFATAIKRIAPQWTDSQIETAFIKEKLILSAQAASNGENVAQRLYDEAITRFGYNPQQEIRPAPRQTETERKVVSVETISKNQDKFVSPLNSGGQSTGSRITLQEAAEMTPFQLMNLDAADVAYLQSIGF